MNILLYIHIENDYVLSGGEGGSMPKTKRQKRSRTTPISRGVGLGVGAGDQAMYQAARLPGCRWQQQVFCALKRLSSLSCLPRYSILHQLSCLSTRRSQVALGDVEPGLLRSNNLNHLSDGGGPGGDCKTALDLTWPGGLRIFA